MTGRRQRDELRAAFLANRERVRTWLDAWEIPEVVWTDEFNEIPLPWIVREQDRESWLKHHAPFLDAYDWLFVGRPLTPGVREVRALWHFGPAHRFAELDLTITSVCDPEYLAEKLTLAVHHAGLKGWRDADAQPLYQWLVEGVHTMPLGNGVRGSNRSGFVLLRFSRFPTSDGDVIVRLTAAETDRALDGSPLDDDGVSVPGG
ncbi:MULTISPECIES: hypothetical protein [Micromonospora]|uniref:hypothetical protein n=1 Tax=Micromonospora TaxID=1873 RepID=UPI0003EEBDC2|nr:MULTISPECIES: hypothetical protein [unclassified Micromonospora]EWM63797.1 hypothetical protein MCBG_00930 [Micromonospora sp. M42]MCK1807017.1 hypothetical protein [Micromonospora sp. R42106]MCK1831703.1 hypothetical protein [Micromonospora sp. R42003]MCK1842603.1 hypothetical protein [Micromonospora sp. R42004]MCM1014983.1 hypothetical protein [Micromonospora sp. XM-20-01]